MFVGIDVGGTKTEIVVTDTAGAACVQTVYATNVAAFDVTLIETIRRVLESAEIDPSAVHGIGIGVPGMVDNINGTIHFATNLNISKPLPLANIISEAVGVPVLIENDTRLAALGVSQKLNIANIAYLSIGTGIAAGIVLNGKVWRGVNGMAGEIGHTALDTDGTLVEHLVSGPAIVKQAQATNLDISRATDLFRLAQAGDRAAKAIVVSVSQQLGRIIQLLLMMYDIEKVVLGGGVTQAGDAFLTPVLAALAHVRAASALDELMLAESKIALLPANFNAGVWAACRLAQQAAERVQGQAT